MILTQLIIFLVSLETIYRIVVSSFVENGTEFQMHWLNGSTEFFNYEKQKSSECIYDDTRDTLICTRNHSYDVITSWRGKSEMIKYVRVRCLSKESNFSRKETCVCKNTTFLEHSTRKPNDRYHSCYLERISATMFNDFINVRVIDLSYNKIRTIDAGSFHNCTALEYLILHHNPISAFLYGMFCGLSRLKFVDFSHQLITSFPSNIFDCEPESQSSVMAMNVSNCRIVEITENSFKYLTNLQWLDLSVNVIRRVNDDVFQGASNLDYVDFSDNYLYQVPESICRHLAKLKYFLLQKNQFKLINMTQLQNCSSLETLDLSDNLLTSLDGPHSPMTSLKSLKLGHNSFKTINNRMGLKYLPFVSELDFSWNRISYIEDSSFDGVKSIRRLDLSSNKLTIISADFRRIFQKLYSLRYLNLSSNSLTSCSDLALDELVALEELDLSYNKLENITDISFTGMKSLKILKLNNNKLNSIHQFSFMNLSSLKSVDLSRNMLVSLESLHFPNIHSLDVSWNTLENIPNHLPVTLSRLLLIGNRISSIRQEDLRGLAMLKELNLSHNVLKFMAIDSFLSSSNITLIDLSFNILNLDFEKDVFRGLKQIGHLTLKHNNITSIDNILQFYSLMTLQALDVSYNIIEGIREPLNPHNTSRQLQFLNLESCRIRSIIKSAFINLPVLKTVNLQNNMIMNIPQFDDPQNTNFLLKYNPLVCSCNMSWMVDTLSNKSTVSYDVDVCKVFPHGWTFPIRYLSKDQFLCPVALCPDKCYCYSWKENGTVQSTICTGSLLTIPSDIQNTSLSVYLDGNNFTELGTIDVLFITQMSVKRLFMNNSKVFGIASTVFKNTQFLEELDLSYNSIKILPYGIFHGTKFLKELDISYNSIKTLSSGVFRGLTNLKSIRLQHNKISHLPNSLFNDLNALETFDISANKLRYLFSEFIHQLDNMKHFQWINLASNPWKCDCSNKALRIWLQETFYLINKRNMLCNNEEMLRVNLDRFTCPTILSENIKIGLICVLVTILALSLGISLAYYRKTLIPVLYTRFGMECLKRKLIHKSKLTLYDLTVLVDDKDHKCVWWVKNSLVPKLTERKRKFRIHVPEPNIEGGEITIKTVYKINQSSATLILASKHFHENYWCVETSKHAYSLARFKQQSVVLLLWGNINIYNLDSEMRHQIERGDHLYIKDKFFWEKLMYKLPTPNDLTDISSLCEFNSEEGGEEIEGFSLRK